MDKPKKKEKSGLKFSNIPLIAYEYTKKETPVSFIKTENDTNTKKSRFTPKLENSIENISISVSDLNMIRDDVPPKIIVKTEKKPFVPQRRPKLKQGTVFIGRGSIDVSDMPPVNFDEIETPHNPISNNKNEFGPVSLPLRNPNVQITSNDIFYQDNKSIIKLPSDLMDIKDKLGKLRVHKSGRISLIINNSLYLANVTESTSFLQTITEISTENKSFINLGTPSCQIIITPDPMTIINKRN